MPEPNAGPGCADQESRHQRGGAQGCESGEGAPKGVRRCPGVCPPIHHTLLCTQGSLEEGRATQRDSSPQNLGRVPGAPPGLAPCPSLSTWLSMECLVGSTVSRRHKDRVGSLRLCELPLPSTSSPALKDRSRWEAGKQRLFEWALTQDPSRLCGVMSVVPLDE